MSGRRPRRRGKERVKQHSHRVAGSEGEAQSMTDHIGLPRLQDAGHPAPELARATAVESLSRISKR